MRADPQPNAGEELVELHSLPEKRHISNPEAHSIHNGLSKPQPVLIGALASLQQMGFVIRTTQAEATGLRPPLEFAAAALR